MGWSDLVWRNFDMQNVKRYNLYFISKMNQFLWYFSKITNKFSLFLLKSTKRINSKIRMKYTSWMCWLQPRKWNFQKWNDIYSLFENSKENLIIEKQHEKIYIRRNSIFKKLAGKINNNHQQSTKNGQKLIAF